MKYFVPFVLALLAALALIGCARKPLTPATPWADVANDSLSFFTTSTDPGGLRVCYVFDWGDGSTTTTGYFASGDTGYCPHEFADTRVRYVRVRARNENGVASGWSPSLRFRLSEPPGLADTIRGLRCAAVNRRYHASVCVTDMDGDSVAVKFLWDDSTASDWSALVPSGSVVTDSCVWTELGPHIARVILRDEGCTLRRPNWTKTVNVSAIGVAWSYCGDAEYYDATPTLGMVDGEPVLFCGVWSVLDCYALDGRRLWRRDCCGSGFAPSLSPDGSRLYLTDLDSGLVCLDTRTGQLIWTMPLASIDGAECTPAIGPSGAIYMTVFGPEDYWLRRVSDCGESAAVNWNVRISDDNATSTGSVAVGTSGFVYAIGQNCTPDMSILAAVDSAGTVLGKDSTHLLYAGPPVVDSRDRVVVTDETGGLYCFNIDGSLAYNVTTTLITSGSTAIGRDGDVIVTDQGGWTRGYDSAGREIWSSTANTAGWNTPCVAQESTVIAYDADFASVYALDDHGRTLWEYSVLDSLGIEERRGRHLSEGEEKPSPVIGPNGNIYLANAYYGFFCLSGTNLHMANTAWPTYNHDNAHSGWAGRQQR
jgi:hypothetical protein